jgi:hypothetical protein
MQPFFQGVGAEFRTNAAFLLGAYLVLEQGYTPEAAAAPFARIAPSPFLSFRDASLLPSDFDLSIVDCLKVRFARLRLLELLELC